MLTPLVGDRWHEKLRASAGVRWLTKGGLAVLDQGLFAGGNFVINVLLARWLDPSEYGAFALAYSIFLLFASFHSAVLIEPMLVFGSGKYAERMQKYLGILLLGHFGLTLPLSLVVAAVAFLLGRLYSATAQDGMLGLAASGAFILLFWLVRRAFYIRARPGGAALAAGVYLIVALASVFGLWATQNLSATTAFGAMAAAGLAAGALSLAWLRPQSVFRAGEPDARTVARDHWTYGRWSLATAVVMWLPANIYYALLPAWLGLEGVAGLRALMNLAMPMLHSISAIAMLLLPRLVRDWRGEGRHKTDTTIRVALAVLFSICAVYLALIWVFRSEVFEWLYGGKYQQYAGAPLLLVCLLPFWRSTTAVFSNALRARERPDHVFWCYTVSTVAALAVGVPLAATYGVSGGAGGLMVSSAVTALSAAWIYRQSSTGSRVPHADSSFQDRQV